MPSKWLLLDMNPRERRGGLRPNSSPLSRCSAGRPPTTPAWQQGARTGRAEAGHRELPDWGTERHRRTETHAPTHVLTGHCGNNVTAAARTHHGQPCGGGAPCPALIWRPSPSSRLRSDSKKPPGETTPYFPQAPWRPASGALAAAVVLGRVWGRSTTHDSGARLPPAHPPTHLRRGGAPAPAAGRHPPAGGPPAAAAAPAPSCPHGRGSQRAGETPVCASHRRSGVHLAQQRRGGPSRSARSPPPACQAWAPAPAAPQLRPPPWPLPWSRLQRPGHRQGGGWGGGGIGVCGALSDQPGVSNIDPWVQASLGSPAQANPATASEARVVLWTDGPPVALRPPAPPKPACSAWPTRCDAGSWACSQSRMLRKPRRAGAMRASQARSGHCSSFSSAAACASTCEWRAAGARAAGAAGVRIAAGWLSPHSRHVPPGSIFVALGPHLCTLWANPPSSSLSPPFPTPPKGAPLCPLSAPPPSSSPSSPPPHPTCARSRYSCAQSLSRWSQVPGWLWHHRCVARRSQCSPAAVPAACRHARLVHMQAARSRASKWKNTFPSITSGGRQSTVRGSCEGSLAPSSVMIAGTTKRYNAAFRSWKKS